MFRASLPVADASDTAVRAGVEDNLAHRLRATAMEGGRAHGAIHRGFQSDRVGRDLDPDYPVGIRLPALPEEAGGTLALGTLSSGASPRDACITAARPSGKGGPWPGWSVDPVLHRHRRMGKVVAGCLCHLRR